MIKKTRAIVLRVVPYSRTSQIVTWLTPDHGKVGTIIKGACRPRSWFLGQYDLAYTCELMFYIRERNGLHIARECSPLNMRMPLREDWRRFACAEYLCDILSRVSSPGDHHHDLYDLAESTLDHLCLYPLKRQVLYWFELRLMTALGVAPRLAACSRCDRPSAQQGAANRALSPRSLWQFSVSHGGLLCPSCSETIPPTHPSFSRHAVSVSDRTITPDVLALMQKWQASDSLRTVQNTKCSKTQFLAFADLLGIFLAFHLDLLPASRKIAADLVEGDPVALVMNERAV